MNQIVYATRCVNTEHELYIVNLRISLGVVCVPFNHLENIKCTITTHTSSGSCMRGSDMHTALVEVVCGYHTSDLRILGYTKNVVVFSSD